MSRSNQPWNPFRFRRSSVVSRRGGCWEDVHCRPCQVLEQGIHVQLRHGGQAETTGRPRVYVGVTPGYRSRHPKNHSARGTHVGPKRSYSAGENRAFSASRGLLVMLTDPSMSLKDSPKRSTFETGLFAGRCRFARRWGRPRLGTGRIYWNWDKHRSGRRWNIA